MTDEIETNSPIGKVPDVHDVKDHTTPAGSSGSAGSSPSATDKALSSVENKLEHTGVHQVPHAHFRWHAEAIIDGHEIYQGIVKDVSMRGANFLVEHNFQHSKLVKLKIHVPPLVVTAPQHIVQVSGKITSTVYDSAEDTFRSAISFIEFTLPSDNALLQSRIASQ